MLITKTPLRISVAGGGTDFPDFYEVEEGKVISTAIDKYIYILIKERYDSLIIVSYSQREEVEEVDQLQHELVREALKMTGVSKRIEIHILADIRSKGSGLGSSSSFTVGLLNALYLYKGIQVTAKQLAEEACEIEIDRCSKPIGKQDQYIAAYGGFRSFSFLKSGEIKVDDIRISETDKRNFNDHLLLFYTGVDRKAETILEKQRENISDQFANLKSLKRFADNTKLALENQEIDKIGSILKETWELKKGLATGISNTFLDQMYDCAIQAGAKGGKICGAGGGGHLLLFVEPQNRKSVRFALKDFQEVPFIFDPMGSRLIFGL